LGSRDTEKDDGCLTPARDVFDEVEQGGLGPVYVVDEKEKRPVPRERLEEATHRPEDLGVLNGRRTASDDARDALDDELLVQHPVRTAGNRAPEITRAHHLPDDVREGLV